MTIRDVVTKLLLGCAGDIDRECFVRIRRRTGELQPVTEVAMVPITGLASTFDDAICIEESDIKFVENV